ncbi:hypothetical protein ACFL1U_00535 [Patescibacteria group bacterium]
MPNENLPKRKASYKIALNILIIVVIVAGVFWIGSYWMQMPTASLMSGKVAEEETIEMVKTKAQQIVELYYTYSAGDSPMLLQSLQTSATTNAKKQIAELIETRKETQGGFVQVATVNETTDVNIRERAAALDYTLKIQHYRLGAEVQEQEISATIRLVNEDGVWLLAALSPSEITWP